MVKDLLGQKFGKWTVLNRNPVNYQKKEARWDCVCECGTKHTITGRVLARGGSKSCGCADKKNMDLTGKRFGSMVVQGLHEENAREGARLWKCLCDCGNLTLVRTAPLNNGSSQSCGCKRNEGRKGEKHHLVIKMRNRYGEIISEKDYWYKAASRTMHNAQRKGVPFGFESRAEMALYLRHIATPNCPVFDVPFTSGVDKKPTRFSPSVDKIVPELGYVPGNIQIISYRANTMKSDANPSQLFKFAVWAIKHTMKLWGRDKTLKLLEEGLRNDTSGTH